MSSSSNTPTNPVAGTIKIGKHTAGHGAWLKARGYKVTEGDGKIVVEGSSFVDEIDLTGEDGGVAALKAVIEAKSLLTYSTKAKTAKGERSSIMLCTVLGPASALVVKPVGTSKAAKVPNAFAAL